MEEKSKTKYILFVVIGIIAIAGVVFVMNDIDDTQLSLAACIEQISDTSSIADYESTQVRIDNDSIKDFVLKGTSDPLCGSAGCIHELCLVTKDSVRLIPFGFATKELAILNTLTEDFHDIELRKPSRVQMRWNGTNYAIE